MIARAIINWRHRAQKRADTNDDKNDYNNATGDASRTTAPARTGFFLHGSVQVMVLAFARFGSVCVYVRLALCASVRILLCCKSRCQSVSGNNALLCWHIFPSNSSATSNSVLLIEFVLVLLLYINIILLLQRACTLTPLKSQFQDCIKIHREKS